MTQQKPVEPGFILNITMTVETLNLVLTSLEAQPYKMVFETIMDLRTQAMSQIAASQSLAKSEE